MSQVLNSNELLYNNLNLYINERYQKLRHNKYDKYLNSYDKLDNLFFFKLIIYLDGKEKEFSYYGNKKYVNLIETFQKIKYNKIKGYKIIVNSNLFSYELNDIINPSSSSYVNQSNNIFVEFTEDYLGYANCICFYLDNDINNFCVSPPN